VLKADYRPIVGEKQRIVKVKVEIEREIELER
jgi:hypothetical protein